MARSSKWALWCLTLLLTPHTGAQTVLPEYPAGPLVIITHVDVIPQFTAPAIELLSDYQTESRRDAGADRIEVLQQIGRPNHFTIEEKWNDGNAYDKHVSASHTREFRAKLQPMLGAPYDERLHSIIGLK
jgi:quinol monooxygenase YgiN